MEESARHIRREDVAVNQIGAETAQEVVGAEECSEDSGRGQAQIQPEQIEGRGPLLGLTAQQCDERDGVTARLHALTERHHLPFRSAHA